MNQVKAVEEIIQEIKWFNVTEGKLKSYKIQTQHIRVLAQAIISRITLCTNINCDRGKVMCKDVSAIEDCSVCFGKGWIITTTKGE